MKKIILLLLVIILISTNSSEKKQKEEEIRGIFISYIELQEEIKGKEEQLAKKNIDTMIQNIKRMDLNTIILQVRPTADAIYPSTIYPYSQYISEKEGDYVFDVLEYFLTSAHKYNIKLFAWINPYRIRTTTDIHSISKSSPAYQYLNTDVVYIKDGIYWNPAKDIVTNLIIQGVKEILNYPVDGILFDDYFYPSKDIDQKDYELYKIEHPDISQEEFHLQIINHMIEEVHKVCQKKKVKFGISPDGNIENNYQKHYADVKTWLQSNNYIDFIIPQIYYGFYNSTQAYTKVIKEWEELMKTENIDFYIALAFYKVGREDAYAKAGRNEWLENDDIIMREVLLSRNLNHYKGFFLFRYGSLFNDSLVTTTSKKEEENLKKVMK